MITDTDCGDEAAAGNKNEGSAESDDESEDENQEEKKLYEKIDR